MTITVRTVERRWKGERRMIDSAERERIIEALKNCLDRPKCKDCPWHECEDVFGDDCVIPRSLAEKALALVEELMTVERKRGRWISENPRTNSWTFLCSSCGGKAYFPRMGKRDGSKVRCGYEYCPHCKAIMEGVEE
jgi:hypothetical protein